MSHHHHSDPTPEEIDDWIEHGEKPEDYPGANWSPGVNDSDVADYTTDLTELKDFTVTKNPATVILENMAGVTFKDMLADFKGASNFVAGDNVQTWNGIAQQIVTATGDFREQFSDLEAKDGWKGKTHDAAVANATQSLVEPAAAAQGAKALSVLLEAFQQTIFQTKWYFTNNADAYQSALDRWPHHADQVNQGYDSFARTVMAKVYAPNINQIASSNPGFSPDAPDPNVGNPPPPPPNNDPNLENPPPPPPPGGDTPPPPPGGDTPPPPPGGVDTPPPPPGGVDTPPPGGGGSGPSASDFPQLDTSGLPGSGLGAGSGPGASDFPQLSTSGLPGSGLGAGSGPGASDFPQLSTSGLPGSGLGAGSGPGASDFPQLSTSGLPGSGLGAGSGPGASDFPQLSTSGIPGLGGSGIPGISGPGGTQTPGGGSGSGLGNALTGLTNPATSALSPATDAVKQALGSANQAGGAPGGLPGGLPKAPSGLGGNGPDALNGGAPGTGGPHGGGGGGGAGIGPRGLDIAKPLGAPIAAVSNATGAAGLPVGASPAGAGSSAGGGPAGGGGGGQRGPNGKEHKSNKALRRTSNGELIMGDVDAVVPVIGDDGQEPEPTDQPQAPMERVVLPRSPASWSPMVAGSPRGGVERRAEPL